MTATYALAARLVAKPTKSQEVADLLSGGLADVEQEPGTTAWFAVRFGLLEFGLYMVFPDEVARKAHLTGKVAAALKANDHLFEETPVLETADVLAAKLPAGAPRHEDSPTATH
ncbi:putative quinol monooxygenase [Mycobacterium sp. 4D054]|uniref:putative quinol monooxygenase n=1 Tax=Mycobacterium sp. 4D054 TaxID=3457440 RepID=UPI003FCF8B5A